MTSQLAQLLITPLQARPANEMVPTGTGLLKPKNLRHFGQKGYVYVKMGHQNKMAPRATEMYMVGYAVNHAPDTYRMYNPVTKSVVMTRDVKWDVPIPPIELQPETEIAPEAIPQTTYAPGFDDHLNDDDPPPNVIPYEPAEIPAPAPPIEVQPANVLQSSGRTMAESNVESNSSEGINEVETGRTDTAQKSNNSSRLSRELAKLESSINYERRNKTDNQVSDSDDDDDDDDGIVVALTDYVFVTAEGEPHTVNEALSGPDSRKWRESIENEIQNFVQRGAWEKHCLSEVLAAGYKPIGTKTVFKIKREHDGSKKYKTRIVSLGYNMRPGEHFHNSFSPVATDMSIRMILAIGLMVMNEERSSEWKRVISKRKMRVEQEVTKQPYKRFREKVGQRGRKPLPNCFATRVDNPNPWVLEMFDVEAAFLNADPGVKIFIKVPDVMMQLGMLTTEEGANTCYRLRKTMYGNVDAALRFFIKYKGILRTLGFTQCQIDPCVFIKRNEEGQIKLCWRPMSTIRLYREERKISMHFTRNSRSTSKSRGWVKFVSILVYGGHFMKTMMERFT